MRRLVFAVNRELSAALALLFALMAYLSVAQAGSILEGENKRISDAGAAGASLAHARIAERNGTLYAVWEDDRVGGAGPGAPSGIYFARSTDGGASWSANRQVNNTPLEDWVNEPDIAVQSDGTIWIVWHLRTAWVEEDRTFPRRNDVRIAKSTDGGESFQVSTLVDGLDGDTDRWTNRIVVDESTGTPYVMTHSYVEDENSEGFDFYLLRYDDASAKWSSPTIINDVLHPGRLQPAGPKYSPWFSLDARDGLVCAAWEDRGRNIDERQPVYGACSIDGGASFGASFPISDDDNIRPEISIGPDGELYVIYAIDSESEKNIRLRRSIDQGETWSEARQVTYADGGEAEVQEWEIAVDANGQLLNTYIYDYGAFDSSDLYLATSIDQGQNFSFARLEDEQGERSTTTNQSDPSLAVGGAGEETYAVIAWKDRRNSTDEIWSQRVLLDGIPPTAPTGLTATGAERAVILTWEAAQDAAGIGGYRVYRATDAAGPFTERTTRLVPATWGRWRPLWRPQPKRPATPSLAVPLRMK